LTKFINSVRKQGLDWFFLYGEDVKEFSKDRIRELVISGLRVFWKINTDGMLGVPSRIDALRFDDFEEAEDRSLVNVVEFAILPTFRGLGIEISVSERQLVDVTTVGDLVFLIRTEANKIVREINFQETARLRLS